MQRIKAQYQQIGSARSDHQVKNPKPEFWRVVMGIAKGRSIAGLLILLAASFLQAVAQTSVTAQPTASGNRERYHGFVPRIMILSDV